MGQIGRVPVDGMDMRMVFDVRSPAAEAWLGKSSERIVEIVAEQRRVIRQTLQAGMAVGNNPRTTALDIVGRIDPVRRVRVGGVLGLTEQQAGWVANGRTDLNLLTATPDQVRDYFASIGRNVPDGYSPLSSYKSRALRDKRFDAMVDRAVRDGKPLTQAQIDKAITQMQNRAQRYRGETVARTESLNALRAGHHDAVAQAIEVGDVDARDTYHTWDATGGGRTRDAHMEADGQRKPINEPFVVGGELLMYPGDPAGSAENIINCRCKERTEIDFAGKLRRVEGFG